MWSSTVESVISFNFCTPNCRTNLSLCLNIIKLKERKQNTTRRKERRKTEVNKKERKQAFIQKINWLLSFVGNSMELILYITERNRIKMYKHFSLFIDCLSWKHSGFEYRRCTKLQQVCQFIH